MLLALHSYIFPRLIFKEHRARRLACKDYLHDLHRRDPKRERGGANRLRTDDLRRARAALSQLSYSPGIPFAVV